jgi:hypothetical protein
MVQTNGILGCEWFEPIVYAKLNFIVTSRKRVDGVAISCTPLSSPFVWNSFCLKILA